jgi:hypothetical protein
MQLFEMFDAPINGMQDVNDDNSKPTWRTSRKTKLTLSQIRKLRKMLDVRNYEKKKYLENVRNQYGAKPEQAEGAV